MDIYWIKKPLWNETWNNFLLTLFHPYFVQDNIYTWVVQSLMLLLFKSIPIYCSFSNVWTKNNNNEEKAKDPIFPPAKKKRVSLGIHLFQRPTSTGSEPFSLLISLDATIFVLPIACVAGVRKGRVRELGRETTREGGGRRGSFLPREPHTLSPAQIPPSPLS